MSALASCGPESSADWKDRRVSEVSELNTLAVLGHPFPDESSWQPWRCWHFSFRPPCASASAGGVWSRHAHSTPLRARFTTPCPTAGVGSRSVSSAPTTNGKGTPRSGSEAGTRSAHRYDQGSLIADERAFAS